MKSPIVISAAAGCTSTASISQESQIPRNPVREPQNQPAEKQQDPAPEKSPEQQLLPSIESSRRRHLFVFVANVVAHRIPPFFVHFGLMHLRRPHPVHQQHSHNRKSAQSTDAVRARSFRRRKSPRSRKAMATRTPVPSAAGRRTTALPSSERIARETCNEAPGLSEGS